MTKDSLILKDLLISADFCWMEIGMKK